jgi:hypothetical protein
MPSTLQSFLASLVVTLVIAAAAFLIAMTLSMSSSAGDGDGAHAGGVSRRFVNMLMLALPVIFGALFFVFRRAFR